LTETDGLTDLQRDILRAVGEFTEAEIIPVAGALDRSGTYPDQIVARMAELGVSGLTIDPAYGGLGESLLTYALVAEEIARGWMSISGIINTHFIVAYLISRHGTAEQKAAFLPKMATGEIRAAFSMSEPGLGSDVAAIRTTARRGGDDYLISGQKMWLTERHPLGGRKQQRQLHEGILAADGLVGPSRTVADTLQPGDGLTLKVDRRCAGERYRQVYADRPQGPAGCAEGTGGFHGDYPRGSSAEVVALVQVFDEPGLDRPPPEQLAGERGGGRLVDRENVP
jgi:hypothetical protein